MTNTKRIRILLIERDLTVNAAAERIGLAACNLTKMIRGKFKLYKYRQPLAELLGVPVRELFTDGSKRPRPRGKPRRRAAV